MDQIAIVLFGATAVWLSQDEDENRRRYACILGLIGQPFWFYSAYSTEQWGIVIVCFLYAISWARGFNTHWVRRWRRGI